MTKKALITILIGALIASAFTVGPADAKKKKKKKKKPPVCATYVPGEMGAEAETVKVNDDATADAPVAYEFSLDQNFDEGIMGGVAPATVNVQVDPKAATAGLYATFEFPARRDYDLYAYWANGNEAASAHGFQPLIEADVEIPLFGNPANTSNNHAGESKADSENIVGLTTSDCGGYTFQMSNYFGEGGTFELKLWLGEATTDPKPESGEAPTE